MKIVVEGKAHRITFVEVGTMFAICARTRIAGVDYRSLDVPFGFRRNAASSLLDSVRRSHKGASLA
jgi:hypothetical protein